MLKLTIGEKEYTFEFSIEASMYKDCTEKVTELFMNIMEAEGSKDIKTMLSSVTDIPNVAMTAIYAGLLENHGPLGDGSVKCMADAKEIIKQYMREHKEDGEGDFFTLINKMVACMEDDGFFELTGLKKLMMEAEAEVEKAPKKKATKK